jgi:uncharacterized damage-inducible protein DinB
MLIFHHFNPNRTVIRRKYMSTTSESPLAAGVLSGWKIYQEQLVKTVAELTPEQLATRIGPDLRPIGASILHVIDARVSWFTGALKVHDVEAEALANLDNDQLPLLSGPEYAQGLEVSWRMMEHAIASWSEAEWEEQMTLLRGKAEYTISRPFVVWHILEHDLHHGGEITHALGSLGLRIFLPPPPPKPNN